MRLLSVDPHILVSLDKCLHIPVQLLFHLTEHFFLSPLSGLSVNFLPFIIASLSESSIFHNNVLALLSSPLLVDKLFLLLRLVLHSLEDLVLTPLLLHVSQSLHLVHYHLPAAFFPLLALSLANDFFIF